MREQTRAITEATGMYISSAMHPYTVVDDPGFKYLLKVLEPRYTVPSCAHISQSVGPSLYTRTSAEIEHELSTAPAVALTTDEWTSCTTESYLTVTAHFIDSEWEMKSPVLQGYRIGTTCWMLCPYIELSITERNGSQPAHQQRIYDNIVIVLSTAQQSETRETTEASPSTSSEPSPSTSSEPSPLVVKAESEAAPSPSPKRSAMSEIFGPLFKTVKKYQPDLQQRLKDEVYAYMAKECISIDSNPLA
ncbi:E3 SUMO-protein ligase ZBED1 [Labeo rohita]|uniref:E3 SUMO-protein ligase ZBED1 n=1 Tax=Labeo rohita TaxID=84645 RepID=A0ABQ8LZD5_LABRO|nr:E3 SUMO-protein ligase ZBED1 [Labeo rohita]